MDPSRIVRSGYDAIADPYLKARLRGADQLPLLGDFMRAIPKGATVLDAGCGAGLPIAAHLASSFRVLGVDFSMAQLRLARELVPTAHFICQDLSVLGLTSDSVDGICCFYSIIHIPRVHHPHVLRDLYRILRPNGAALLCLGAEDLPEEVGEYQGAPMFWSHFDANTYLELLSNLGYVIIRADLIPDPIDATGSHLFVLARKPGA